MVVTQLVESVSYLVGPCPEINGNHLRGTRNLEREPDQCGTATEFDQMALGVSQGSHENNVWAKAPQDVGGPGNKLSHQTDNRGPSDTPQPSSLLE